jgi:hypothetical protein
MKKILRLVTTSVLTLTLVACGEASSSVSNGTNTSSSVSSTTSAFANVSTITLSAASDVLTQTMGTQKAVVVQAALNANTNPSLALEWFVNGTKSNQTGRVFEYTPAAAGTFVIEAKVGSVLSNKINVTVGAAALVISELKVVDNNTLEIKAPGGATVAVTNNEVLATSFYDIGKGIYVIELKTALIQGGSTTVTLTRDGLAPVSRLAIFDTRKLDIDELTVEGDDELAELVGGVYEIERPFILGPIDSNVAGAINTQDQTVLVTFESENLKTAAGAFAAYKIERTAAPSGAPAFVTDEGQVVVSETDNVGAAGGLQITFDIDRNTPVGDYKFNVTLGGVSKELTIRIKNPVNEIDFVQNSVDSKDFDVKLTQLSTVTADNNKVTGLTAVGGVYEITKDFLLNANASKVLEFTVNARNFNVPASLLGTLTAPIATTPNQLSVSLLGPASATFMRVETGVNQSPLPNPVVFRNDSANLVVSQKVDSSTPAGEYTYTVRVAQLGTEVLTKTVKFNIKNPAPKLTMTATLEDPNNILWENVARGLVSPTAEVFVGNKVADTAAVTHGESTAGKYYLVEDDDKVYRSALTTPFALAAIGDLATGDYFYDTTPTTPVLYKVGTVASDAGTWAAIASADMAAEITTLKADTLLARDKKSFLKLGATPTLITPSTNNYVLNTYTHQVWTVISGAFDNMVDATPKDVLFTGSIPETNLFGELVASVPGAPSDADVTAGKLVFEGSAMTSITVNRAKARTTTGGANTWEEITLPDNSILVPVSGGTLAVTASQFIVSSTNSDKLATTAQYSGSQYLLLAVNKAEDKYVLLKDTDQANDGWAAVANAGTFAAPVKKAVALAAGQTADTTLIYNGGLTDVRSFTLSNAANLIYGNPATGSLQNSVSKTEVITLKETSTGSGIFEVNRPINSSVNDLEVNFKAELVNFQSPLNPQATVTNSFAAAANEAGIAGPREFVKFTKAYSGPMTLESAFTLNNVSDELVAIRVGAAGANAFSNAVYTGETYTSGGVADRNSVAPKYYDLYTTSREKLTLADVFTLPVKHNTVNGNYRFSLTIGDLVQNVVVSVINPTPKIVVNVLDVENNRMVAPNAANEYIVSASSTPTATLKLDVDFLNMIPATAAGYALGYTLTRSYKFGTTEWTDVKTNTITTVDKVGGNGHLTSSLSGSDPVFSQALHALTPEDLDDSLDLTSDGTYTYKLQVGTASLEWKVIVNKFPTATVSKAFLGSATVAGTTALPIFDSQPIVKMVAAAAGNAKTWLEVKPVNMTGTHYYQVDTAATAMAAAPVIGGLTATQLAAVKLDFSKETALVGIEVVTTSALVVSKRVFFYNSAKVLVGYADYKVRVIDSAS